MKRIFLVTLTLFLLIFSGCTSNTANNDELKPKLDPIVENILLSMKNNDYESFIKDMDEKMKATFTKDYFKTMNDKIIPEIGNYQSKEYWQAQKSGDYMVVFYKAKFDKEKDVVVVKVVLFEKDGKTLVSGLFFDSPNLRK